METNRSEQDSGATGSETVELDVFDESRPFPNTTWIWGTVLVLWGTHSAVELYAETSGYGLWQFILTSFVFPITLLGILYICIKAIRFSRDVHLAALIFVAITICRLAIAVVRVIPYLKETPFIGPNGEWTVVVIKILNAGCVCSLVAAFCLAIVSLRHSHLRLLNKRELLTRTIRQRDQIQSSARSSERYFQLVYDAVPDVIFIKDLEGRYLALNQAAEDKFKMPNASTLGKNSVEIFGEQLGGQMHEADRRVLDGETVDLNYRLDIDGVEHSFDVVKVPLRGENGIVKGVCGVTRDVTERVQMEEERNRLQAELMQTQKLESMEVLAGGIAHDFNNLLTGILGHVNVILADLPDDSSEHDRLQEVRTATEKAAYLSQQMLLYSGKLKLNVDACDLNQLVKKTWNEIEENATGVVNIEWNLAGDLQPIQIDSTQLQKALVNLFLNAVESMDGETGTIKVTSKSICVEDGNDVSWFTQRIIKPGLYAVVEIADDGCGMSTESMWKIFDPFYSTKFVGRGLGMAAVYGIVRSHDGFTAVDSELGVGTVVRLLLPPVQQPKKTTSANNYMSARMGFSRRSHNGATKNKNKWFRRGQEKNAINQETILIVDDEEIVLNATAKVLGRVGYNVFSAGSGMKALELFRDNKSVITMVLLDLSMPEMTGEEVFTEIRKIDRNVPVLFTSGYDAESVGLKLAGDDVTGFLPKPFTPETLISEINQLLHPV